MTQRKALSVTVTLPPAGTDMKPRVRLPKADSIEVKDQHLYVSADQQEVAVFAPNRWSYAELNFGPDQA